jgi:HSP20 family molecular chaperone IbpA
MNPNGLFVTTTDAGYDPIDHFFDSYDSLIAMVKDYWNFEDFNPRQKFPLTDFSGNEKDGTLRIECALAGYSKDDLNIKIEDYNIIISAKVEDKKESDFTVISKSIKKSNFEYCIPMAQKYDVANSKISYIDGILTIDVPVKKDSLPKNLKIN